MSLFYQGASEVTFLSPVNPVTVAKPATHSAQSAEMGHRLVLVGVVLMLTAVTQGKFPMTMTITYHLHMINTQCSLSTHDQIGRAHV